MAKRSKGVWRALDLGGKRRRGKGLAGLTLAGGSLGGRGRRREKGLAGHLRLEKKGRGRRKGMSAQAAEAIRERMTRTERLQVRDAIRDAQENDEVVTAAQRDAQRIDPNRQNVVQRLVAYVRNRLSVFRRED